MIRGAIFDVDGTLLDSMQMWINFGHDFLSYKGIEPPDDIDEIIQYFSLRETCEYFSKNFSLGDADDIEKEVQRVTEEYYFQKVQLKAGVYDLLQKLARAGVKMYIATATYKELIIPALQRNGIFELFEGIVTCPEVGAGKDRPDVFLQAQRALNTKTEETWIFEDARHAIVTAKKSGFPVCAVFDETESSNREEIKDLSDIYAESFEELDVTDF
ncbi:MAG: HAD family hydrolase [Ruminococcaceae bacterium]|nr:HAD family hydrolase [Oscillospiraceae bacterium]